MKKLLITGFLLAATTICAIANERLYIEAFDIDAGETKTVSMLLENEETYTAFQTDLYLPDGITLDLDYDEYIIDPTSRLSNDFVIVSNMIDDNVIRILVYSMNVSTFSGTSGAIVTLQLTADNNFKGTATVELKNTLLVKADGSEYSLPAETCTVNGSTSSEEVHNSGDVNHDESINITDVTTLIDRVLAGAKIDGCCEQCADVNGDNDINISDVTSLIDLVLAGG